MLPQISSLGQRLPQQQDGPTPCPPQGRAPRAQAWPSSQTLGNSSEFFELPVLDPNYGVWGGVQKRMAFATFGAVRLSRRPEGRPHPLPDCNNYI